LDELIERVTPFSWAIINSFHGLTHVFLQKCDATSPVL
jgi:hypothetical protein